VAGRRKAAGRLLAWGTMANPPPTGTITFRLTGIQSSTRLRQAIEARAGCVFKRIGDAPCAAFPTALLGIPAAAEAQQALVAAG
jgi:hypothetical protein